ncbi:MAG: hypothetical protein OXD30_00055 [Bryobacterales bacterium]|nr:hypothetical protein [Bryobacterales bacterium]
MMVKVPEGLVLAADSAATVQAGPVKEGGDSGPSGILKVYFTATKVFQIRDLPVGVLAWGASSLRARTVASLVEEFENSGFVRDIKREDLSVEELAKNFWDFMSKKSNKILQDIPKHARPRSGFLICGYSVLDFFPEEYLMVVPIEKPKRLRPPTNGEPDFGANWYGSSDAIVQLHHGRDDRIFDLLRGMGIESEQIEQLQTKVSHELQYQVLFSACDKTP